jgi:hypothetical protein
MPRLRKQLYLATVLVAIFALPIIAAIAGKEHLERNIVLPRRV